MKDRINVSELLKDCPKGMELDCTMFDEVTFEHVDDTNKISIKTPCGITQLSKYGCYHDYDCAKCVIYPKGKTTWEGFVPPYKFKDGDITVSTTGGIHIMQNSTTSYCQFNRFGLLDKTRTNCVRVKRLATEEEKEKLFQAIKDNGYKWNPRTKTLEKLIEPIFKVGDRIRNKKDKTIIRTINYIYRDSYGLYDLHLLYFKEQDDYELVPDKFDINTLKPFDKVLVRDFDNTPWEIELFSRLLDGKHFKCLDVSYMQCIPYEGNEHLLGTTNDCDESFKTWE